MYRPFYERNTQGVVAQWLFSTVLSEFGYYCLQTGYENDALPRMGFLSGRDGSHGLSDADARAISLMRHTPDFFVSKKLDANQVFARYVEVKSTQIGVVRLDYDQIKALRDYGALLVAVDISRRRIVYCDDFSAEIACENLPSIARVFPGVEVDYANRILSGLIDSIMIYAPPPALLQPG